MCRFIFIAVFMVNFAYSLDNEKGCGCETRGKLIVLRIACNKCFLGSVVWAQKRFYEPRIPLKIWYK